MNNLETEHGMSESCNTYTRYIYTLDSPYYPTELDSSRCFCKNVGLYIKYAQFNLYGSLPQTVQQQNCFVREKIFKNKIPT